MPLDVMLLPIFFMLMAVQVKLETLFNTRVLMMADGLLLAAALGKFASGLGGNRDGNRLAVGLGMTPWGEGGLLFAAIGTSPGVISDAPFSAVVLMLIVTTLLSPPLLKRVLERDGSHARS